jgi:hypothetical protein
MAFSPWTPSLKGIAVTPCDLTQELADLDVKPDARKVNDEQWTLKKLKFVVDMLPDYKEALMESVLAVWRLKETQEKGLQNMAWRLHVEAWLVSRA